jgi:hypothetical protein
MPERFKLALTPDEFAEATPSGPLEARAKWTKSGDFMNFNWSRQTS